MTLDLKLQGRGYSGMMVRCTERATKRLLHMGNTLIDTKTGIK